MQSNNLNIKFHHIGFVCENIDKYKLSFTLFSEHNLGLIFEDVNQNVKVEFIDIKGGYKIELIEILNEKLYCPIKKFVDRNTSGFHHLCYESDDIDETLLKLKNNNFRLISKTTNGFEGRTICFLTPKNNPDGPLIEIISNKV